MHDTEPDSIILKSYPQKLSEMLSQIGVESIPQDIASDEVEKGDYYGRYFVQTPRMVTNKGCLTVKGKNINIIQIIQKG
jgi:hypothetical protein